MTGGAFRWTPAYIGLGSNLDSPRRQIDTALAALKRLPQTRLIAVSPVYRSAPMGPADQPDYLNAAAALLTRLGAEDLLAELQSIEKAQGRERDGERWGPRTLDLDLLVYGRDQHDSASLTLPHPGIAERNFVLFPLRDIAPHLGIPGLSSVSVLAAGMATDRPLLERLDA